MRNEFVHHAALAFYASAWSDLVEDNGGILRGEILDQVPMPIDPAAIHAAKTLAFDIERKNGKKLEELLDFIDNYGDGDRPNTTEYFGHYAAMQSMGHGVGLYDAFGEKVHTEIKIPYVEFGMHNLERDY